MISHTGSLHGSLTAEDLHVPIKMIRRIPVGAEIVSLSDYPQCSFDQTARLTSPLRSMSLSESLREILLCCETRDGSESH